MLTVERNRLKSFNQEDFLGLDPSDELDAAQDAGVSIRLMRDWAQLTVEALASRLNMEPQILHLAEQGQFVGRANDGTLYDFPASLLLRVARVTGAKFIPLPWIETLREL